MECIDASGVLTAVRKHPATKMLISVCLFVEGTFLWF